MKNKPKITNQYFGQRLKQLRSQHGLTQAQVGKIVDKGDSTIRMWELRYSEPDYETIALLANYFGVTIDYLLGRDTAPSAPSTPPMQQPQEILTDDQKRLLRVYDELTPPMQEYLIETAENLAAKQTTRKKFNQ